MKATLLVLLVLLATAAFGQSLSTSILSSQPVVTNFTSHSERAVQKQVAAEQNILFTSTNTYARGERPLWEVAKPAPEIPLGDVARMFRAQHATARKAVRVFEK